MPHGKSDGRKFSVDYHARLVLNRLLKLADENDNVKVKLDCYREARLIIDGVDKNRRTSANEGANELVAGAHRTKLIAAIESRRVAALAKGGDDGRTTGATPSEGADADAPKGRAERLADRPFPLREVRRT